MQEELDHARKEIEKRAGALDDEAGADDSDPEKASRPSNLQLEINLTLEIGQVSSNWHYKIHKSSILRILSKFHISASAIASACLGSGP